MRNTGAILVFAMPTSGGLYEACVSRIFTLKSMDKTVQVTTHKKKNLVSWDTHKPRYFITIFPAICNGSHNQMFVCTGGLACILHKQQQITC